MFTLPRQLAFVTILGALLQAATCESAQLYDEARDKQGMAAKKAWDVVDLNAVITTERENLKSLLDSELDTQDQLATSIRNNRLRYMVSATVNEGIVDPVKERLVELVLGNSGTVEEALLAMSNKELAMTDYKARQNKFNAWQPYYDTYQLGTPSCASVAGGETPKRFEKALASADSTTKMIAEELLDKLRKTCTNISDDTGNEIYKDLKGLIGEVVQRYLDESNSLITDKKVAEKAKEEYATALAAYKQAMLGDSPDTKEKVQEAASKLGKVVKGLEELQSATSAQFLSEERLKSLQAFIKVVTSTKDGVPPAESSTAAVALVILPTLADSAQQSLADTKKALALPLLIQRDHEQLQLEAANRDIAARQIQIDLSKKIVETVYEQARQLALAYRDSTTVDVDRKIDLQRFGSMKFTNAFDKASPDEKELLYTSAARYLDVIYRYDATRYKLEYMRVAAIHEQSLSYAEINAKQWQLLIGATVNQLVEYGAGGVKAESIADLINAAGVLWIGHGVNE